MVTIKIDIEEKVHRIFLKFNREKQGFNISEVTTDHFWRTFSMYINVLTI